jgi:hypothetical protein
MPSFIASASSYQVMPRVECAACSCCDVDAADGCVCRLRGHPQPRCWWHRQRHNVLDKPPVHAARVREAWHDVDACDAGRACSYHRACTRQQSVVSFSTSFSRARRVRGCWW